MARRLLLIVLLGLVGHPLLAQEGAARRAYIFAAGLHDRGLYARAVEAFQDFLARFPHHREAAAAHEFLGESLFKLGRLPEALKSFAAVRQQGSKTQQARAALRSGEILLKLKRPREAVSLLQQAGLGLGDARLASALLYRLAEAQLQAGSKEPAEKNFKLLLKEAPRGPYAAYAHSALGYLEYGRKAFQEARMAFDRARAAAASDRTLRAEAGVMEGASWLELQKAADARKLFEEVLAEGAGSFAFQARLGLGRALLRLGLTRQASQAYQRLARHHPKDARLAAALIEGAAGLSKLGDPQGGLALLGLAPQVAGQTALDLAYWRGRLLLATGASKQALEQLEAGVGHSLERRFRYGEALNRTGRFEKSARLFAALKKESRSPRLRAEAAYAEAFALSRLGRHQQALAVLLALRAPSKARELARDRTFALAENLFALKRYQEALGHYTQLGGAAGLGSHGREALYKSGWCLYLLNKKREALKALQAFTRAAPKSPKLPEARYLMGKCREALGELAVAAHTFEELTREKPEGELALRAQLGAAALARRRGDRKAALSHYQSMLQGGLDQPHAREALLELADLLQEMGRKEEAARAYGIFLKTFQEGPDRNRALLGRAWSLRALKRHPEALALAQQAARQEGDTTSQGEALYLQGIEEEALGHHTQAARVLENLVRSHPRHPRLQEARLAWGVALMAQKHPARARLVLETLLKEAPKSPQADSALWELARVLASLKQEPPRLAALKRLAQEHPRSPLAPQALFLLGEAAYDAGRFKQAMSWYGALEKASAKDDLLTKARYKRGWCWRKLEQHESAARLFTQVAEQESHPLAAESLFLAGEEWQAAGNARQALKAFDSFLKHNPSHALARHAALQRLLILASLGRNQEVIAGAQEVLASGLEPARLLPLWSALGDALMAEQHWERARAAYQRVTRISEGKLQARAHWLIGQCFEREGRGEAALEAYLKVIILYKDSQWAPRAALASGRLLLARGEKEKARRILRELVQDHPQSPEARQARDLLKL